MPICSSFFLQWWNGRSGNYISSYFCLPDKGNACQEPDLHETKRPLIVCGIGTPFSGIPGVCVIFDAQQAGCNRICPGMPPWISSLTSCRKRRHLPMIHPRRKNRNCRNSRSRRNYLMTA